MGKMAFQIHVKGKIQASTKIKMLSSSSNSIEKVQQSKTRYSHSSRAYFVLIVNSRLTIKSSCKPQQNTKLYAFLSSIKLCYYLITPIFIKEIYRICILRILMITRFRKIQRLKILTGSSIKISINEFGIHLSPL